MLPQPAPSFRYATAPYLMEIKATAPIREPQPPRIGTDGARSGRGARRGDLGAAGQEEADRGGALPLEVQDDLGAELVPVAQELDPGLRDQDPARLPAGLQAAGQVYRVAPQVVRELALTDDPGHGRPGGCADPDDHGRSRRPSDR